MALPFDMLPSATIIDINPPTLASISIREAEYRSPQANIENPKGIYIDTGS